MKEIYQFYYRTKGLRYSEQLLRPVDKHITSLPRDSLFHVLGYPDCEPSIDTTDILYSGYQKKLVASYVTEYVRPQGVIRRPMFNFPDLIRPWKQKNIKTWEIAKEPWVTNNNSLQLIVVNYAYIETLHRWQPLKINSLYKWNNRYRTLYATMNEIATKTNRHQFVRMKAPSHLVGRTMLDKFRLQPDNLQTLTILARNDVSTLLELDFWRWFNQDSRHLSLLSEIDPKNYSRINFIFEGVTGKTIVVNLSFLDSWIKGRPNTTYMPSIQQKTDIQLAKMFVYFLLSLNNVVDEGEEDISEDMAAVSVQKIPEPIRDDLASTGEDIQEEIDTQQEIVEVSKPKPYVSVYTRNELEKKIDTVETPKLEDDRDGDVAYRSISSINMDSIEKDLEALDKLTSSASKIKTEDELEIEKSYEITTEEVKKEVYTKEYDVDYIKTQIQNRADENAISAADYRKMMESVDKFRKSKDPYGSGMTREEAAKIDKEEINIQDSERSLGTSKNVVDPSMFKSSLKGYTKRYVNEVMHKDVMNAVNALHNADVIVTNHEVSIDHSVIGSTENHVLEVRPLNGQPSTIRFSLPVVDDEGVMTVSGTKYFMRKQRVDLPIRKIAEDTVQLSSYYGKSFVQRSQKVSDRSTSWLFKKINESITEEKSFIHGVTQGNSYNNDLDLPYLYQVFTQKYSRFSAGDTHFTFNYNTRTKFIEPDVLSAIEKDGKVFCGLTKDKNPIVIDRKDIFHKWNGTSFEELGDIYKVLQLDQTKAPVDFAIVQMFSKSIPLGFLLGYYIGFKKLLKLLECTYRTVETGKRANLEGDEYRIVFEDYTYVFSRKEKIASLVLSGFNEYEKLLKRYTADSFDDQDGYLTVYSASGLTALYTREFDMMDKAFVDPITKEILEDMGEPVTFRGLLLRATELLLTHNYPDSIDRNYQRDRGYERFAGIVYKELMASVRNFNNKNILGRSKIEMSPYQIINRIMDEQSIKTVESINPIQNLKEDEIITYSGEGGRSAESMPKVTRAYSPNDVGILSESTVDNSGVGITAYLSGDPNIRNMRGMAKSTKEITPTSVMSTPANLSPGSYNDTPKRIMFITTQHGHTTAANNYKQPQVRTGYEFMIGRRTGKMFCTYAEEDGRVTNSGPTGITIEYKSGKVEGIETGRVYGSAEGTYYPHDIVTTYKKGDIFKKGDLLSYNSKFFERDYKSPSEVILKASSSATVAFMELIGTYDDACIISPKLGDQTKVEIVKVYSYVIGFKQEINYIVKEGQQVDATDIMLVVEDEITSGHKFSDEMLKSLADLSKLSHRCSVSGKIDHIEVYYNGDKENMTPKLKDLVDLSDRNLAAKCRATSKPVVTGRVTSNYRTSGKSLEEDSLEIKIYVSVTTNSGVGDKLIFGHQMKSIVSEVTSGPIYTQNGTEVDAIFSYTSCAARTVLSPLLVGTTSVLLDLAAQRALKAYKG